MKKNYFAVRAAYTAVRRNLEKVHPDWASQRLYAATRAIMKAQSAKAAEK